MLQRILFALTVVSLIACSHPAPKPAGPASADGLVPLSAGGLDQAALQAVTPLRDYAELFVAPIRIDYARRTDFNRSLYQASDFEFDQGEQATLREKLLEALQKEWPFQLVEQPGNDSLTLTLTVDELYLFGTIKNNKVQPSRVLTSESSRMTLVAELRDAGGRLLLSSSDQVVTGERDRAPADMLPLNSVRYWQELARTLQRWAALHRPLFDLTTTSDEN